MIKESKNDISIKKVKKKPKNKNDWFDQFISQPNINPWPENDEKQI